MKSVFAIVGVLGVLIAVSHCHANDNDDNSEDDMVRAIKIVYGGEARPVVGFEATKAALKVMVDNINKLETRDGTLENYFKRVRSLAQVCLDSCELKKVACSHVLEDIKELKAEYPSARWLNLGPYLETCEERQMDFCVNAAIEGVSDKFEVARRQREENQKSSTEGQTGADGANVAKDKKKRGWKAKNLLSCFKPNRDQLQFGKAPV